MGPPGWGMEGQPPRSACGRSTARAALRARQRLGSPWKLAAHFRSAMNPFPDSGGATVALAEPHVPEDLSLESTDALTLVHAAEQVPQRRPPRLPQLEP